MPELRDLLANDLDLESMVRRDTLLKFWLIENEDKLDEASRKAAVAAWKIAWREAMGFAEQRSQED